MTAGLKISSKHKNVLYARFMSTRSIVDGQKYKKFKTIFEKTAKRAEILYYNNIFDRRCNIK